MIRTTVSLDEATYIEARKKAIEERKPFGEVVNKALRTYLAIIPGKKSGFTIKPFKMGKIKGNLSRREIYADI